MKKAKGGVIVSKPETVTVEIDKNLADQLMELARAGAFGSDLVRSTLDTIIMIFVATRVKSGQTKLKRIQDEKDLKKERAKIDETAKELFKMLKKGGDQ